MKTTLRLVSIRWRAIIAAICLALGASAGMASQPRTVSPAGQAVYWCPMHPDIRGKEGDTCPICKMALVRAAATDYDAYRLDVEITPHVLRARQNARIRFSVRDPHTQVKVRHFELVHERVFHLFVISQDLEYFAHIHPTLRRDGSLDVDVELPRPGVYQLIADFLPVGGAPQLVQKSIVTAGYTGALVATPHPAPDLADKIVGGTRVKLTIRDGQRSRRFRSRLCGPGRAVHVEHLRHDQPPVLREWCDGDYRRDGADDRRQLRELQFPRQDQRFLSLSFAAGSGVLSIQAPANANLAPPGYYMLFLVNNAGVPSVAPFVQFAAPGGDTIPPTPPIGLIGAGAIGSATLSWTASTDNTGVALYNVHRSTTSGFQPTAANRIGQPTSTSLIDTAVTAGTYFYVVTAQDVAGNVSTASNEAAVVVLADTTPPTVTLTAPANGATVSGSISVSATASDDVNVAGVQFRVDGQALGAERTTAPYSVTWNTASATNASHTLTAVARDAAGNSSQAAVDVVVSNTSQTPGGLVAAYGFNEGAASRSPTPRARAIPGRFRARRGTRRASSARRCRSTAPARG